MKMSSFRMKLFLMFVLSIFFPLIILSALLSIYFNKVFFKETEKLFLSTIYSVSENIQIYLDDLRRFSLSPNLYPEIMETYKFINSQNYNSENNQFERFVINKEYSSCIQKLLTSLRTDVIGIAFIPINELNSNIYVIGRYDINITVIDNYDYKNKSWYDKAIDSKGAPIFSLSHYVDYYNTEKNENVFSVVKLVKDMNRNESIGIIKVDAYSNVIKDMFKNIKTGSNSVLMLVDQNKNVICSNQNEYDYLARKIKSDKIIYTDDDIYHLYTEDIEATPWKLAYFSSEKDIKQKTIAIYYVAATLWFICIAIAFIIFYFNSTKIISPLKDIILTMKKIEIGDLSVRATPNIKNYEFYLIATALNNMIESLNIHIDNEYKAVLSQKNAEYLALQTQINPHFLYNVLNGFITLNRIGDKKTLENSIIQLTTLFRYTCNNESKSTIGEEIDFVEKYLSLQKLRFDERLEFNVSLDENIKDFKLPKLLIQPLVENSIVHGMEPSDKPIFIEVYTYLYKTKSLGDFIMIIVLDNGIGFDTKKINENSHVGLSNIRERIELFNKNAFFTIKSTPKKLTACYIIIPYR